MRGRMGAYAAGSGRPRHALESGARNARVGESNGNARLTEHDVRALRREAARETRTRAGRSNRKTGRPLATPLRGTDIFTRWAAHCGLSRAAVCMAAYGETWGHVPGALPKPTSGSGAHA